MFTVIGKKSSCGHLHNSFKEAQDCLLLHQNMQRQAQQPFRLDTIIAIDNLEDLEELFSVY